MSKKMIEFFRIVIISFEFLTALLFFLFYNYFEDFFSQIGKNFLGSGDITNIIYAIPTALIVASIKFASDLLTPLKDKSNNILYEWPDFWKLKMRVWIAISISIFAGIVSIASISLNGIIKDSTLACLFFGGIAVSGVAVFSEIIAKFKLREILDVYNKD